MLFAAPKKPTASQNTPPINSVYTQSKIRQLLDIVCHGDFINFQTVNIFLKMAGDGLTVLERMLPQILDIEQNPDYERTAYTARIKTALAERSATVPQFEELLCVKKLRLDSLMKDSKDSLLSEEEKGLQTEIENLKLQTCDIEAYDWAVICKLAMQKGTILSDTLPVNVAKRIFLEEIKDLYPFFERNDELKPATRGGESVLKFNEKAVRPLIKKFIGQLLACEDSVAAEIIHNYLHLAFRLLTENTLNENDVAMTFAPGLFEGLGIFQKIKEVIPSEEPKKTGTLYRFLQLVLASVVGDTTFRTPFNRELYQNLRQSKFAADFEKANEQKAILKAASGGTANRNSLSSFASKFASLSFSPSSEPQAQLSLALDAPSPFASAASAAAAPANGNGNGNGNGASNGNSNGARKKP